MRTVRPHPRTGPQGVAIRPETDQADTDGDVTDGARGDVGHSPIPNIADAIGGPVGALESALPTVVFVAVISFGDRDVQRASIVAVAVALVLAAIRLMRRETIRFAAGGLLGVVFAAFVAAKSGRAENFFLPGLLLNLAYGAACLVSLAARRPAVGYFALTLHGMDPTTAWHRDRAFTRAATWATWMWASIFLLKLAVQLPLYLGDHLVALGVAKLAMGYPLYGLGVWWTWLLMRGTPVPGATDHRAGNATD